MQIAWLLNDLQLAMTILHRYLLFSQFIHYFSNMLWHCCLEYWANCSLFYHFMLKDLKNFNEQKYDVFECGSFEEKIFEKKNLKSWNKDHFFAIPQKSHVFWLNIINISFMLRNAPTWIERSPNYVCYVYHIVIRIFRSQEHPFLRLH